MKRIALTLAALALSAGAAFAAAPATPGAAPLPAKSATTAHKTHAATPVRNSADAQRMTKALNILEAKGYASFNNFKPDGSNYSATVSENGREQTVVVNPDNGQVTAQS